MHLIALLGLACTPGTLTEAAPSSTVAPPLRAVDPVVLRLDGGVGRVTEPRSGLSLQLHGDEASLQTVQGESFTLRLAGATAGEVRLESCPPGVEACEQVATVERGAGIQEWWTNSRYGLMHGFVAAQPTDALRLTVELEGARAVSAGSRGARLVLPSGQRLSYSGLRAWDADGQELSARMEAQEQSLALHVDTSQARFPVVIDPVVGSAWTGAGEGWSVVVDGDIQGDGYDDLIVVDPYDGSGSYVDVGYFFVYWGTSGGLGGLMESYRNDATESYLGRSSLGEPLAMGDTNGDGYDDLVIGNAYYTSSSRYGRFMSFHGSSTDLPSSANRTFIGTSTYQYLGSDIAVGDLNGDGYEDAAVTDMDEDLFVYWGSSSGLTSTGLWEPGTSLGYDAVVAIGDLDGDGDLDLAVGMPGYTYGHSSEGAVVVFTQEGGELSTSTSWFWDSDQSSAGCGRDLATGDFNGDGVDDLAVACPGWDGDHTDGGRAMVFYGSTGGLASSPDWTVDGEESGLDYGYEVASAGDMDGVDRKSVV